MKQEKEEKMNEQWKITIRQEVKSWENDVEDDS